MDIEFKSIQKRFGDFRALTDVSFSIKSGGIHALLGENGAGKTTLMRILSGEVCSDGGIALVDSEPTAFASPSDARRAGVRMVHQHLSLVPALTITENFLLDQGNAPVVPRTHAVGKVIAEEAGRFGMSIAPDRQVWELSLSEQQWIEVFRAMYFGSRIVILDEPTSLLSPVEGDRLLAHLKTYAEDGRIVILITHKLREVMRFATTVTVLRRGHVVETSAVKDKTTEELTALMMGVAHTENNRASGPLAARTKPPPILSMLNVAASDQSGKQLLSGISLSLAPGWICGVAGVAGNGQTDLANIAAGIAAPDKGEVRLENEKPSVRRYVPADRTELGTSAELSIIENLVLRAYQGGAMAKHGVLNWEALSAYASNLRDTFEIKMRDPSDRISTLSGGNIQRVVLARELSESADILVAHNPTSGLDMATAGFARKKLREAASQGSAILLISDDLDEILDLADEILVLHAGRIAGHFTREEATIEEIGAVMAGLLRGKTRSESLGRGTP